MSCVNKETIVMADANKAAQEAMDEEVNKFGFARPAAKKDSDEEEEDQDMGDLDSEEEESDDSEDESESEEESEDSEDDSEEEENEEESDKVEEPESQKKKSISFKKFNELRSELREANRKLKEASDKNVELEAKLPDDFQERVKALATEIGVEDPDNLTKIMNLVKDATVGNIKGLEAKITALEKQVSDNNASAIADEFPNEWVSFEKDFLKKEFPNATDEQLKTARDTMKKLAGTKDIGGKVYIHPDTNKEALDPYPLDYIFFRNKKVFEGIITGKKSKGMETSRTAPITTTKKEDDEEMVLPNNASAEQIRKLDKIYSKAEAGTYDGLRAPTDSTI